MDRCRDYFSFAVWFAGIGYAVLWPLAATGNGGRLFGASFICSSSGRGIMATLCGLPHPVSLPLGLHLMGLAAAIAVAMRLSGRLLRRGRTRLAVPPVNCTCVSGGLPVSSSQAPTRRLRTVKPRKHFGLRGTPH
jgi:hypothetical protein